MIILRSGEASESVASFWNRFFRMWRGVWLMGAQM